MPAGMDRAAYMDALQGMGGGGGPETPQSELMEMEEGAVASEFDKDVDPTSQEGETFFVDPDMLPGECKKGQKVIVHATVTSKGSKIGLTPSEIEYNNSDDDEEDQEEYDDEE